MCIRCRRSLALSRALLLSLSCQPWSALTTGRSQQAASSCGTPAPCMCCLRFSTALSAQQQRSFMLCQKRICQKRHVCVCVCLFVCVRVHPSTYRRVFAFCGSSGIDSEDDMYAGALRRVHLRRDVEARRLGGLRVSSHPRFQSSSVPPPSRLASSGSLQERPPSCTRCCGACCDVVLAARANAPEGGCELADAKQGGGAYAGVGGASAETRIANTAT